MGVPRIETKNWNSQPKLFERWDSSRVGDNCIDNNRWLRQNWCSSRPSWMLTKGEMWHDSTSQGHFCMEILTKISF
jgi:hypothetical protein